MCSTLDRIRQAISFELIGVLIVTPLVAWGYDTLFPPHQARRMVSGSRRPSRALDKQTWITDISVMTKFSLHTRFLLNAGNTLNRR